MPDPSLSSRKLVPHPGETTWTPAQLLESFPDWRSTVERALVEDAPGGDVTTRLFIPEDVQVTWHLNARETGILAGVEVVNAVFTMLPGGIQPHWHLNDGDRFAAGACLASLSGPSNVILRGERIALNFLQRLCGVASRTRAHVDAIEGTKACVLDTRKTTPGLRAMEKYAVCCGGGRTHRRTLSDVAMIKDNHLAALDHDWNRVGEVIQALRSSSGSKAEHLHVEIEVDHPEQIEAAIAAGADSLLLDGFSPGQLESVVASVAGQLPLEASGGITLNTIRSVAETGVDFISVGALTNGYPIIDIGLDAGPTSKP